jgi:V/A-type H+-transporting ATPase subunit D
MAELIEGVHPTRMELFNIKRKIKLADKGHSLLKEKRDALIMEFFQIVEKSRDLSSQMTEKMNESRAALAVADAMTGTAELQSISLSGRLMVDVNLEMRNVMGVKVPDLSVEELEGTIEDAGYGLTFTSPTVDRSTMSFKESLVLAIRLSEIEASLRALSGEIEKTKRRVNALEYILLPRLKNTRKYIDMRLEEMERENFSRLKMVKKKKR